MSDRLSQPAPGDLDSVADALIARCGRDPGAPAYTEASFRYKLRRAQAREPVVARRLAAHAADPLRLREVDALIRGARLTAAQRECLTLRLDGFTFADIGALEGTSKQSARMTFVAALTRLRRAWRAYPYAGLAEVYRREIRRRPRDRRP